jgi:GDP-mannose 6-dehydrogenase
MRISVFGLGYVGAVSAGCLAGDGHQVIGIDTEQTKLNQINNGHAPVIEKDLDHIISKAVHSEMLKVTRDVSEAVNKSEISLVCVGTPSLPGGEPELKYLRRVCEDIGNATKNKTQRHTVVIRSTILPGTMRKVVIPILEQSSGKRAGLDFGISNNPEFLREGSAVFDYFNPAKTIIGSMDRGSADIVSSLYTKIKAPLFCIDIESAEMIKYIDNAWHALKVGFANEIGNICKTLGLDGYKLMEIFCQDVNLNISPYYLKPGFAFGGSCLPKDLRALVSKARSMSLTVPILNSILPSNELQLLRGLEMVIEKGNKKVGILGFSFKAGTDDLRESPLIEMAERLLGKGYDIKIYDPNVSLSFLIGTNRDYLINHIPHISKLMANSLDEVIQHAEILVIGNNSSEFQDVLDKIKGNQTVIDLVKIKSSQSVKGKYDGIGW